MAQGAVAAQQQPAQSGQAQSRAPQTIQTVQVTARYVSENIQTTPIAITAQTGAQLQAAHVTNISSLGAVVPNLWTVPGDSQSAGTPVISLRGVQQGSNSSIAVPPAVAIYVDGVYHATTAGSELDLTDIDHIEVNRGPQSTLSGNASIAGSIQIFTKDPVGDNSGYVSVGTGSLNRKAISGAFDLGLTPTLAARFSGSFERKDGFVDRLDFTCEMNKLGTPALAGNFQLFLPNSPDHGCVIGKLGGINHTVGTVKLRWRPNDRTDLILTARKHVERDEETPEVALSYTGSTASNVMTFMHAIQDTYGSNLLLDNRFLAPAGSGGYATYATDCRPYLPTLPSPQPSNFCFPQSKTANNTLVSGKLRYQISNEVGMTAIGSYMKYDNAFTQNGDQSPFGLVLSHFENRDQQYTGEIRFNGKAFNDRLNWVAGAFLLRLTGHQDNFLSFLLFYQPSSKVKGTDHSQSGFFHLDYNITDRWRVSGGARFTNGDIAITINNPPTLVISTPVESKQNRWDWLLSTDYKITDDILAYANVATGSRPPGLTTIVVTPQQLAPTPAEELVSYEAGLKTEFFGHRLLMNVDGFYEDYKKLAAAARYFQCLGQPGTATPFQSATDCNQFAPNTAQAQWYISLAVPATITGAEWDITALPIDGLRIDWTGGYNHFDSGVNTPGAVGYYYPGNHRQPSWNMHADVSYAIETPLGIFTPRVDWNWQSQQDFNPSPNLSAPAEAYIIDPYSLLNAQINYEAPDGNWSATLAVTNLTDKFHYYQPFPQTLNDQTRLGAPREFTFTVRRDF